MSISGKSGAVLAGCAWLLGMVCGCGSNTPPPESGPTPAPFSLQLGSSSVAAFPNEAAATVGITITRATSTAALTASVSNLPTGATVKVTSPGTGSSGSLSFIAGAAQAGTYALTVNVTDGTNTFSQPLNLTIGVIAAVGTASTGPLNEAMSTSFQIAEWTNGFFQQYQGSATIPGAATLLGNLEPQHVRMQILSQAIPEIAANTWDFTMADNQVQAILGVGDHSPEFQIADAPAFMYVSGTQQFTDPTFAQFAAYAANLVRYYNKGGFTVGGTLYKSPSAYPI